MAELFQKSGRARVSGIEVLRWKISLPLRGERIAAFYREIGERTAAYCEGALRERAEGELERSEDENKRFFFPTLIYRLEGRVTYEDEEILSVCLVAELRRSGERSPIGFFEDGQVFEKQGELLLPPERVVSRFGGARLSAKEKRAARGVLLTETGALWHDGARWLKKDISPRKDEKSSCKENENMV